MKQLLYPEERIYWSLKGPFCEPLRENINADVVIIGGGVAGLSAAQGFLSKGLSVVLLEKAFCGSGASGKSSGFITPDSEFSLYDLEKLYGALEAKKLWQFVSSGVTLIDRTINHYSIACDYQKQDTLIVATTKSSFINDIEKEHKIRQQLGYKSILYEKNELASILGANTYYGGIRYGETFAINGYLYCQGLKNALIKAGARVFEETPVIELENNSVKTLSGSVNAQYIIFCGDWKIPQLCKLTYQIYHAQTFLLLSSVLDKHTIKKIFPAEPLMVWDTDLIYNYYRLTGDNRLMVGGSTIPAMYAGQEYYNYNSIVNKLTKYIKKTFANVSVNFEYRWPGLIGISKDIMPIAGFDTENKHLYYISATSGLPWAAALGMYCVERIIDKYDEFDTYFDPYRKFLIGPTLQNIIGTKAAFAISNFSRVGSI